jgi:uncharacterized protein YqgC (DUF456 family)
MSIEGELLVAVVIAIGIVGVVVPVLPGELLIAAGVIAWAAVTASLPAWSVATVSLTVLAIGWASGWILGRRHLGRAGVRKATLVAGALAGTVGFFVLPVVGLPLGFVAGVYAAERASGLPHHLAWPGTRAALRAAGLVLLVQLTGAVLAAAVWAVGAFVLV